MNTTVQLPICPRCGVSIPREAPEGLCPKCVLRGAAKAAEPEGLPTATGEIPSLERIARAFPQLEIIELIGRGGMGFVFKARQPRLERFVALKLLPDRLAGDPQFTERFHREGRVLARMNHPNIVAVFDFGQTGGFYYLMMEHVDGVNLRQAMQAGRFSPAEALALVPKVCDALQYAHEQGILHRDIKPENLLLDAKGNVKIADFGIAKLVGGTQPNVTLTNTGSALGTPQYMAPEQLEKPATVDHRADLYSLGVVLYELLTGELPIGRFAAPSAKTPMSASVDDVVFRTLAKDRELRFQSASEMKTGVEQLSSSGVDPVAPTETQSPGVQVAPWVTRIGILFCLLGAVGLMPTLVGALVGESIYHPALLLSFTGFALVTRWPRAWSIAIGTSALGSALVLLLGIGGAPWHGLLRTPVVPGPYALSVLLWLLFASVFGLALWVLCRPEVQESIRRDRARAPMTVSWWIGMGVALVALSLVGPLAAVGALLMGGGEAGAGGFWSAMNSIAMPAAGGTLMGWLGLNQIRRKREPEASVGMALFAALTWPLLLLLAASIGLPLKLLQPGMAAHQVWVGRLLILLLPAGALGAAFWFVRRLLRWVQGVPGASRQGLFPGVAALVFLSMVASILVIFLTVDRGLPGWIGSELTTAKLSDAAWSPKTVPSTAPELDALRQEAANLAGKRHYAEALQRLRWYYDHALETDPGQSGVRLSFALSQWRDLARQYSPARDALIEIRDRGEQEFRQGGGYFSLFQDVAAINEILGDKEATYALFKAIQARDPALARQCYFVVEELLVERREYSVCAMFIPDVQQRFESARAGWERGLALVDRSPERNRSSLRREMERSFVDTCRRLIEILIGTGRREQAIAMQRQALAVLDSEELRSAVSAAEQRIEHR